MHEHSTVPTAPHPHGHDHEAAVHGMLVVGEGTVYLSHLPMFDDPHHSFQVILETSFTDPADRNRDLQAAYVSDRHRSGERFYTLRPELFVLPELIASEPGQQPRRQFSGTLFAGHFERGGRPLFRALVGVTNVVHFRQFETGGKRPGQLEYIMFGRGQEIFLAHLISAPPDFDQVLPVRIAGNAAPDGEVERGVRVTIRDRANTIGERLKANETVAAEAHLTGGPDAQTIEVQLEARRECYLEEGELLSPANFDQTAEERSAGF